jgi:hypothetical protein
VRQGNSKHEFLKSEIIFPINSNWRNLRLGGEKALQTGICDELSLVERLWAQPPGPDNQLGKLEAIPANPAQSAGTFLGKNSAYPVPSDHESLVTETGACRAKINQ